MELTMRPCGDGGSSQSSSEELAGLRRESRGYGSRPAGPSEAFAKLWVATEARSYHYHTVLLSSTMLRATYCWIQALLPPAVPDRLWNQGGLPPCREPLCESLCESLQTHRPRTTTRIPQ